jgi:hypothetical protein
MVHGVRLGVILGQQVIGHLVPPHVELELNQEV